MNVQSIKLIIILILGIWIGLVIGISFVEAPLKFNAPGITTILGLGIGKLVFGAIDKIQIVFLSMLFILNFKYGFMQLSRNIITGSIMLFVIQLLQSCFLLPALNIRVTNILNNAIIDESYLHVYFVILEILKVILLFYLFVKWYMYE